MFKSFRGSVYYSCPLRRMEGKMNSLRTNFSLHIYLLYRMQEGGGLKGWRKEVGFWKGKNATSNISYLNTLTYYYYYFFFTVVRKFNFFPNESNCSFRWPFPLGLWFRRRDVMQYGQRKAKLECHEDLQVFIFRYGVFTQPFQALSFFPWYQSPKSSNISLAGRLSGSIKLPFLLLFRKFTV